MDKAALTLRHLSPSEPGIRAAEEPTGQRPVRSWYSSHQRSTFSTVRGGGARRPRGLTLRFFLRLTITGSMVMGPLRDRPAEGSARDSTHLFAGANRPPARRHASCNLTPTRPLWFVGGCWRM